MLFEPTTLAATASALIEALERYGSDPDRLFRRAGLDPKAVVQSGARYPIEAVHRLWDEAVEDTGDPCIGLVVGELIRPQALHALGLSWLASPTLLDGLRRIRRYCHIVNTSLQLSVVELDDRVHLVREPEPESINAPQSVDAYFSAVLSVCRKMAEPDVRPVHVTLTHDGFGMSDRYAEFFGAPVSFGADDDTLSFDTATVERRVRAGDAVVADQIDRIADQYLSTLDPELVADKVREILLALLPSGTVSQTDVAKKLNRSVSSLQRQLKTEGLGYSEILEDTRHMIAVQLIGERRYSLSQIAYLLGFSEQANFTRAFKRWTGTTPSAYRKRVDY